MYLIKVASDQHGDYQHWHRSELRILVKKQHIYFS